MHVYFCRDVIELDLHRGIGVGDLRGIDSIVDINGPHLIEILPLLTLLEHEFIEFSNVLFLPGLLCHDGCKGLGVYKRSDGLLSH